MVIRTVALVGASGNLGPFILEALQTSSILQMTVLVRESSKSKFPDSVKVQRIPDDLSPPEALVDVLTGQDALVLAFSGGSTAESKLFIDAAITAGVKRIVPADYGSCDSSNRRSLDIIPLYKEKEKVRNYLIERQGQGAGRLSWTSLITGHFFDYGLMSPLLGLDVQAGTAKVFDGGDVMWSSTTRTKIGMAVRKILELDEGEQRTKNRLVYIQQVRISQNGLVAILGKVTGKAFSVEHVNSDLYITEHREKLYDACDKMDREVIEELVCVEGIVNGDWQGRPGLVNDLLGLSLEDAEAVVRRCVVG